MPALFEQGFFVREPAWHGLGVVLSEYPGRAEAMRLAGHSFKVVERPIYTDAQDDPEMFDEIEGWKALVRDDDWAILNVAHDTYAIIQNDKPWDVLDAILTQPKVHYDTAGVLDGGRVLWVMALVDEPAKVRGDESPIYPYVAAHWTHDGSGAFTVDRTSVRRVCMNTHRAAVSEAEQTGRTFTFRHVGQVNARIDAAREVLAGVRTGFRSFIEMANELAALPVSDIGIEAFVEAFLPMPPEHAISDRVKGNVEEARALVHANLNGRTCDRIRNTAWGLTCAAIEYLDYGRAYRNSRTLLNRTVLSGERAKDDVVALARRTAQHFPPKKHAVARS